MSSDNYAIAMKETLVYLEGIRVEDYNKIPKSLIKYLEDNADSDYVCTFDPNTPLAELNLHEETYGLLSMLYYKYWCKSDSDRKYYSELLAKNEDLYDTLSAMVSFEATLSRTTFADAMVVVLLMGPTLRGLSVDIKNLLWLLTTFSEFSVSSCTISSSWVRASSSGTDVPLRFSVPPAATAGIMRA